METKLRTLQKRKNKLLENSVDWAKKEKRIKVIEKQIFKLEKEIYE